jgi:integrase
MGLTLTIVKTDRKKVDGKYVCPIQIKYSYRGTYKRFSTKEFIEPKYWKEGVVSPRCPDYLKIQKRITTQIQKINNIITDIVEEGGIPTPDLVKDYYFKKEDTQISKQPKPKSFWKSYDQFLKDKSKYHRGYTKTLITLKNKLRDFETTQKQPISFDYILYGRFEREFKDYCLDLEIPTSNSTTHSKTKGLSNNYINKLFSNLKIFLSWCKEERIIPEIKKFRTLKTVRNDVLVYLNTEEVRKMYDFKDYDYPNKYPNQDLIVDYDRRGGKMYWNNKELIKDIFTFQCSVGCRWGDIHKMTVGMFKIEKGFFIWTMEKTKDKVVVPENPISLGIFKKYSKGKSLSQPLFPKYSPQKFNKHLKEIGRELGFNRLVKREIMVGGELREESKKDKFIWELLSSHSGRRSFIKNLIDMGTMDNWSIMKLSGHKSIGSFQKYVSVTKEDITKGGELYSKEIDELEQSDILNKLRKIPKEKLLQYLVEKL